MYKLLYLLIFYYKIVFKDEIIFFLEIIFICIFMTRNRIKLTQTQFLRGVTFFTTTL